MKSINVPILRIEIWKHSSINAFLNWATVMGIFRRLRAGLFSSSTDAQSGTTLECMVHVASRVG